MHRRIGLNAFFLVMALALAGCGNGYNHPGSGNINGSWYATLTNSAYSFSTTFTQGSGDTLSVTNLSFTSPGPCFASDQTSETGTFSFMGNLNGNVTGTFGLTVSTMFSSGTNNVLTLNGTVNGNTIAGTWTLTGGSGCTGNGTFTIQPPTAGG